MPNRDPYLYLDDILHAVGNIREYTADMDYEDFITDSKTQDAVVRNLEIIGEAAARLPENIRALTPELEWKKIIAIRNILVHEYFGVSLPIIWDVVLNKLDQLENTCKILLDKK